MDGKRSKFTTVIISLVIITVSVVLFLIISKMRKAPERVEKKPYIPVVKIMSFETESSTVTVRGTGTVNSLKKVSLIPQISGKIVRKSKNMENGGFFKKGEALFIIDPSEYKLRVEAAKAEVVRREIQLKIEEEESLLAKKEWKEYVERFPDAKSGALTTREPQLKLAKSAYEAANAQLKLTELNLQRTVIRAPFNGRVITKNVDKGQLVSMGNVLATIINTDKMSVTVPVKSSDARWLHFPSSNKKSRMSNAVVSIKFGGEIRKWKGKLVRSEAQLDQKNRMINVIVEIDKPFEKIDTKIPLLSGMFATVEIEGEKVDNIIRIPRKYIRDTNKIWINKNSTLEVRNVEILIYDRDEALIKNGISPGEEVIISEIPFVLPGMKIRVKS